jgi:hypothetical protein
MKKKNGFLLLVIIAFSNAISLATIDLAIISNGEGDILRNGLLQYNDFGKIDVIDWSETPDSGRLSDYDSVIVTVTNLPLENSEAWGNIIADYAENGKGVVLGFAFFSNAGTVYYGQLEDFMHTPFTRGGSRFSTIDTIGTVLIPNHPLMDGVNQFNTSYAKNVTLNEGATLVATFQSGVPLAGYMDVGNGRIVGIQVCYLLNPRFTNNGDYMQLYRNATVYSIIPEPATILLLTLGGLALRKHRR